MLTLREIALTPPTANRPNPAQAGEPPAVYVLPPTGRRPEASATSARAACSAGVSPAPGGAGSGAGATGRRRPRLNVTWAERLSYSRRKLEAISALRNVNFNPETFGLHKDYRVPGVRGKVYLVPHRRGAYAFPTLAAIHQYVAVVQAWRAQPGFTWEVWWQGAPIPDQPQARCGWPECAAGVALVYEGELLCRAHALIYDQMLAASGRQVP